MKERPTNVLHSTPKIQQADTLLKKSIKLLPAVLFLSQVLHTTLIGLNELITVIGIIPYANTTVVLIIIVIGNRAVAHLRRRGIFHQFCAVIENNTTSYNETIVRHIYRE